MRTIIWFIYFWLFLISHIPAMIYLKFLDDEKRLIFAMNRAKVFAKHVLFIAGIKLKIKGLENIPKDSSVIFVSNHQGNFDIPILINSINIPFGFIAKKELKRFPLINRWMMALNCVFISRDNPREAIKSINAAAELLNNKKNLLIFPEGTRSKDAKVKKFKSGALKLASKSNSIIIPVSINGSINAMKKNSLFIQSADVELKFYEELSVDEKTRSNSKLLAEKLESIIKNGLESN